MSVAAAEVRSGAGVDASFTGWLDFGQGFSASMTASFEPPSASTWSWWAPPPPPWSTAPFAAGAPGHRGRVLHEDGRVEELTGPDDDPYRRMVEHFDDIVWGRAEPVRPPSESVELLRVVDRLREAAA